jgi:multicomponent Na+:H+ antiporter subunit D
MAITSVLCIFIGCYTPYLYQMLPFPVAYEPYTSYHVSETLQVLLFTALGFFLFLKKLTPEAVISLDTDWFYRRGGLLFARIARGPLQFIDTCVGELYRVAGLGPLLGSARRIGRFDNRVIDGAVDGLAAAVRALGTRLRVLQRGAVQENLLLTAVVAIAVVALLVFLLQPGSR